MRARNLKPAIFKNEILARLGPWHFILFEGLWCLADRDGRLEDRPERIEAEIFPFKFQKVDIGTLLQGLSDASPAFILRYARDGGRYIQVVNFKGHQRPHVNEEESKIPPAFKTISTTKDESTCHQGNDHLSPRRPESLSSDSPSLTPDSQTTPLSEPPKPVASDLPPFGSLFQNIWNRYPKRDGKKAAERHFRVSVKTPQDWLDIQKALANYLRSETVKKGFIKNGSTWFNNWRDFVDYKVVASTVVKAPPVPVKPRVPEKELTDEENAEMLAVIANAKETLRKGTKIIPKAPAEEVAP